MKLEREKKYFINNYNGVPAHFEPVRQVVIQWYLKTGSTEVRVRYLNTEGTQQPWELAIKRKTKDVYARQETEYVITPTEQLYKLLTHKPCSAKLRTKFHVAGTEVAIDELYDVVTCTPTLVLAEIELIDDTADFETAEQILRDNGIQLIEIPADKQDDYKNAKLARVYGLYYQTIIQRMLDVAWF